jgi:hypothetical protein
MVKLAQIVDDFPTEEDPWLEADDPGLQMFLEQCDTANAVDHYQDVDLAASRGQCNEEDYDFGEVPLRKWQLLHFPIKTLSPKPLPSPTPPELQT